jgi:pimeloyl-ACP methyl ester carboxylesterase
MKSLSALVALLAAAFVSTGARAACTPGAYGPGDGDFVVVVPVPSIPPPGQRYMFRDGRRGSTADAEGPVACADDVVTVRTGDGTARWPRLAMTETDATFDSVDTQLAGRLIEPATPDPRRPLVVMVHGSERTPSLRNPYAYGLAAQGIAVFMYDKRGTGDSEGDYTQNFELLADDAAAALAQARRMAAGRFGRAGYFGGSQGGWVAPLAATRSQADFVAVGFGLVASPIEEDRDQMLSEARELGLGEGAVRQINRLSQATARLMTSHFTEGFEALEALRGELRGVAWAQQINGEHSGAMLRLSDAELRRIGRARFDNLELIWGYDAIAALRRVDVPLLWILAGEDREAPIEGTRRALTGLMTEGKRIDLYLFPDTDHGMVEFVANPDGSRRVTRITDGYLQLVGDWIKGAVRGPYGRGERLR